MRFLADENFPAAAVRGIEEAGHDIVWVRNAAPGAGDAEVLEYAARENRILLTFDKDFGELARNSALPLTCDIVLFHLAMPRAPDVGRALAELAVSRSDWAGHFSVIEADRIRMRPIG
jgi:hypothetical protein